MRVAIFFAAILMLVLGVAALPMSAPAEAVTKTNGSLVARSAHDFSNTVDALETSLRRRGVATIVKLDRPDAGETLVLFQDPQRASRSNVMRSLDDRDLPLRALVYRDGDGVSIAYDDARSLAKRHGMNVEEATVAGRVVAMAVAEAADD